MSANAELIGSFTAIVKLATPFLTPILASLGSVVVTKLFHGNKIKKLEKALSVALDTGEFMWYLELEHVANSKLHLDVGFKNAMRENVRVVHGLKYSSAFTPSSLRKLREEHKLNSLTD